jgi:hypothetical protein
MQFAFASMEVWLDGWDDWEGAPKKVLMEPMDRPEEPKAEITSRFSVLAGGKEATAPSNHTLEMKEGGQGQLHIVGEEGEGDVSKKDGSTESGSHTPGDAV